MIMDIKECRSRIKALQKTIDYDHKQIEKLDEEKNRIEMEICANARRIDDYYTTIENLGWIQEDDHLTQGLWRDLLPPETLATGEYESVESDSIKFNHQPEELS